MAMLNVLLGFQVLFKNLTVDIKDVKPTSLLKDRLREVEGNPKLGSLGPQLQYSKYASKFLKGICYISFRI